MRTLCIALALVASPLAAQGYQPLSPCYLDLIGWEAELSDDDREQIWKELHYAIHQMNCHLDRAETFARKIESTTVREASINAIQGAVCGLATRNPYGVVISAALNVLANIAGDYWRWWRYSVEEMAEAEGWANIADRLQNRLLMDE